MKSNSIPCTEPKNVVPPIQGYVNLFFDTKDMNKLKVKRSDNSISEVTIEGQSIKINQ